MNEAANEQAAPAGLHIGQPVRDMYQNYGYIFKIEQETGNIFTLGGKGGMHRVSQRVHIVFTGENPHISEVTEDQAERYAGWHGHTERAATITELTGYVEAAKQHREQSQRAALVAREAHTVAQAAFQVEAAKRLPANAKAVIIAELHEDKSDSQSDYWGSTISRKLILGFSTHTRDLFPEMRKAARNAPETADLADAPESFEHREKYSMGGGFYLGSSRHSGWQIRKTSIGTRGAASIPMGEWRTEAPAPVAVIEPAALPGTAGFTIEEHTHTKKGFQMFIVVLADRVERAEYDRLLNAARDAGGWYTRAWGTTPGGFAFKTAERAQEFASANISGTPDSTPPPERAAVPVAKPAPAVGEKLRALADGIQKDIDSKLADRETNTAKRMGQAMSARMDGYRWERTQAALRALADLHDAGTCPPELCRFTSKAAVHSHMAAEMMDVQNGFHSYRVESSPLKPYLSDSDTLALWALLDKRDPEQEQADKLRLALHAVRNSQIPGYFPTPPLVVAQMLDAADIQVNHLVLEPSAGDGAIAAAIPECLAVIVIERNYSLVEVLRLRGFEASPGDFMEIAPTPRYDRVVMNPPFENQQDVKHVMHAFKFLKPGGRLVAIMSPSWQTRQDATAVNFRAWLSVHDGEVVALPDGSFKESGTGVSTVMVTINN